jgi:hypothetical protein
MFFGPGKWMAISALNFRWLTDPHDLQGIPTPRLGAALSYIITTVIWQLGVGHTNTVGEVGSPSVENRPPGRGYGKMREKFPK